MSMELLNLLRENKITIVNEILAERNSNVFVGYQLRSPSVEKHKECIFIIAKYMMRNDNPYTVTDGSNNKDIFLHLK